MGRTVSRRTVSSRETPIPSFFLYGEAPREVNHHFLHLEPLDDRSRPADWNIRPHAHPNLSHIFVITQGSGEMRTDAGVFRFDAPALLIVPAQSIHAFVWAPATAGRVLTVSQSYLNELLGRERQFDALFAKPDHIALGNFAEEAGRIADALQFLERELAWTAPAHGIAVEAQLLSLLVTILRVAHSEDKLVASPPGRQAELVARFREAVEARFRNSHRLDDYAQALGATLPQLRTACLKVARRSPLRILRDRVLLEAKRLLLYSNLTVNEAAFFLGFDDPAYFSRVFTQATGLSPRAFRLRNMMANGAASAAPAIGGAMLVRDADRK
jgi:AraC family transcriptional activator of pobA